jgi:orotate phosphoribosyltransferase
LIGLRSSSYHQERPNTLRLSFPGAAEHVSTQIGQASARILVYPSKASTEQRKEAVLFPILQRQGHRHRSAKVAKEQSLDNLWLAQILFDLGGVQFGNFTVSESAVSSPVFVNPKVLISNPTALRVASKLMQQEINLAQSLRRPRVHPFTLVAGVPVGGLLLAMSYSLETNIPMIYARIRPEGTGKRGIEGRFSSGDTALIFDDLITRGSSVLETATMLEDNNIKVKDVIVLIDREHGAAEHLRHHGYNLLSILKLDVMLTHYVSKGLISEETYRTCAEYLRSKQDEEPTPPEA